uniref:Uncharacterized protein n=1 Tax=Solanum lycopersicum TaxID=4081 RepID=K4C4G9_SOLLC
MPCVTSFNRAHSPRTGGDVMPCLTLPTVCAAQGQ